MLQTGCESPTVMLRSLASVPPRWCDGLRRNLQALRFRRGRPIPQHWSSTMVTPSEHPTVLTRLVILGISLLFASVTTLSASVASSESPEPPTPTVSASVASAPILAVVDVKEDRSFPTTTTTTLPPPPTTTTTEAPRRTTTTTPQPVEAAASSGGGDPYDDASWNRLASCETGGTMNWATNTGNSYYGGLQFSLSSWQSVGGTGLPSEATRGEQIHRGQLLWEQGGWAHWPACTRSFGWR
jgi:hypothetical protein